MESATKSLSLPHLKPGDVIGATAPAGRFNREDFDKGRKILEEIGLKVFYTDDIWMENGYLAGPDEVRAASFRSLCQNPDIKSIIAVRGGYGSVRMLPFLDSDTLSETPKLFIGFSDATYIHGFIYRYLRLPSLHGPNITSLADQSSASVQWLADILYGRHADELKYKGESLCAGKAGGVIWGGNLTVISHMIGTDLMPQLANHILLLEDVGEKVYRIDRALYHLKQAGIFSQLAGVALGRFDDCGDPEELNRLFRDFFPQLSLPVITNISVGHVSDNLAVPLGQEAEIEGHNGILTVFKKSLP